MKLLCVSSSFSSSMVCMASMLIGGRRVCPAARSRLTAFSSGSSLGRNGIGLRIAGGDGSSGVMVGGELYGEEMLYMRS